MLSAAESSTRALTSPGRIRYARIPESPAHPEPDRAPARFVRRGSSTRASASCSTRSARSRTSPARSWSSSSSTTSSVPPKYTELECRTKDLTFSRPLYVNVELLIKETGEIQRQRVYMGDFPTMTDQGTFVINGAERVVVSQLVRSPGVYYSELEDPTTGRMLFSRQGHPEPRRLARVRDQQQGPALGQGRPQAQDRGDDPAARRRLRDERRDQRACSRRSTSIPSIRTSRTPSTRTSPTRQQDALIEVYKKLRPGDPPTGDNARQLVESLFFNFRRYDLGRVGRYKFNKKLDGVAGRMGIELPRRAADDHPRGHRRDRRPPHRVQPRPPSQGRHRPPRQPPHPRQRRADPERLPDRPPAHGARRPRADDDPGDRQGHPERPHQHPARSWPR